MVLASVIWFSEGPDAAPPELPLPEELFALLELPDAPLEEDGPFEDEPALDRFEEEAVLEELHFGEEREEDPFAAEEPWPDEKELCTEEKAAGEEETVSAGVLMSAEAFVRRKAAALAGTPACAGTEDTSGNSCPAGLEETA